MMRAMAAATTLALSGSALFWPHGQVRAARATGRTCAACSSVSRSAGPQSKLAAKTEITALLDQLSTEAVANSSAPPSSSGSPPGPLASSDIATLAAHCAPSTPVSLIQALVKVESGRRVLLVAVNGARPRVIAAADPQQGRREIHDLTEAGANFDVGLMQLNSATLARLGVAPEEALDPCRNLAIGAKLFEQGYARAFASRSATVPLLAAYSSYNTGDLRRGYANGYAGRVDLELRRTAQMGGPS